MRDPKLARLSAVPLFRSISQQRLRRLASLADEVEVRRGTMLTTRSDEATEFYVVEEGRGRVQVDGHEPLEVEAGGVFGELPVPHAHTVTRSQTLVADTDLRMLVVRREVLPLLEELFPELSGTLSEAVALHSGF